MSLSGISASPQLKTYLDEIKSPGSNVSVVRVQIGGESLIKSADKTGPADGNFEQLLDLLTADEPSFYLLRKDANKWYLITWMPEGKVVIKDRMVYASSQTGLKDALGYTSIADTFQFSKESDITGREEAKSAPSKSTITVGLSQTSRGVFKSEIDPRTAMSNRELDHLEVLHNEDEARDQHINQIRNHINRFGTTSVVNSFKPDPNNHHSNDSKSKLTVAAQSGGFHSVVLPLTPGAKDFLKQFDDSRNSIASVELIVKDRQSVDAGEVTKSTFGQGGKLSIITGEPRFYALRLPSGIHSGEKVFVYFCPEDAAPKLRMVYSTSAQGVLGGVQSLGCEFEYKVNIYDAKDMTFENITRLVQDGSAQKLSTSKSVDQVIDYRPSNPARSVPTRFVYSSAKPLAGFTDEAGFRNAFNKLSPSGTPSGSNTPSSLTPTSSFKKPQVGVCHTSNTVSITATRTITKNITTTTTTTTIEPCSEVVKDETKPSTAALPSSSSPPPQPSLSVSERKALFAQTTPTKQAPPKPKRAPVAPEPKPPTSSVDNDEKVGEGNLFKPSSNPKKPSTLSKPAISAPNLAEKPEIIASANITTTDNVQEDKESTEKEQMKAGLSYLKSELTYSLKDAPQTAASGDPWKPRPSQTPPKPSTKPNATAVKEVNDDHDDQVKKPIFTIPRPKPEVSSSARAKSAPVIPQDQGQVQWRTERIRLAK